LWMLSDLSDRYHDLDRQLDNATEYFRVFCRIRGS